jgi:hypothetical protein
MKPALRGNRAVARSVTMRVWKNVFGYISAMLDFDQNHTPEL